MKNLRLAIRSLLHFRLYSAVNVLGLALSLACVIVIARYVHNETTVDGFNTRLDRTYVLTVENSGFRGELEIRGIGRHFAPKPEQDIRKDPAVERYTEFALYGRSETEIQTGENKIAATILVADTHFLRIFDYPVTSGNRNLKRPEQALITEAFARKLFGVEDPLGRTIKSPTNPKEFIVSGIIGRPAYKSSLDFDVLVSSESGIFEGRMEQTVLLLHPKQEYRAVNEKFNEFISGRNSWMGAPRYQLFPLKEVYFNTFDSDTFRQGNRTNVIVLLVVAILLLTVGVLNFLNIYTAVVLRRGREFGMKKVFGASGRQVFGQLLVENGILIVLAMIIALSLIEVLHPVIRNLLGFEQLPFVRFDLQFGAGLLIALPLLTSAIPYLRYNFSAPVTSLRSVGKTGRRGVGRWVTLTFQYLITLAMIMVSLLFLKQLRFVLDYDPGYASENIVQVQFQRTQFFSTRENWHTENEKRTREYEEITRQLDASPLILSWVRAENPIRIGFSMNYRASGGEYRPFTFTRTTGAWMRTFEPELVAGRLWDDDLDKPVPYLETDEWGSRYVDKSPRRVIVDESALKAFGIIDYREAVIEQKYREFNRRRGVMEDLVIPYEIIGVIRDFKAMRLSDQRAPFIFHYEYGFSDEPLQIAFLPERRKEVIEFLRRLHDETVGGEFTYLFIEDDLKALYAEERKVATVYGIFTGIAIAISVLGLFSLSLFDIQQRRREIAIRKVNGATTGNVLGLLLKRYLYLLLIAFVIAVPLAWFAIQRYLEGFAHKTAVSWWIFAVSLLVTAGVSLSTLIRQTRKAASADPARVIRSE
ncbi:MAG: ABC transporter permease [Culturomica sp.]|jgi:ABC-type antimicrobial peptide transport system permease subunit|nr:ABC transporter permease [Culturomica sp.]